MAQRLFQDPVLFEEGDRLTPEEFLTRWECMPNLKFAELINGVVYLPSPVSPEHARSVHLIDVWAGLYALRTGISEVLPNVTWLMEKKSVPQPDVALRIEPEYGGNSTDTETYPAGPPEFVAEVSRSTRSYDPETGIVRARRRPRVPCRLARRAAPGVARSGKRQIPTDVSQ
ncbi:MAG: Uma2 family endonuclease [Acidobacteriia bacterium]|nr:Uma2 family endonuclease [Terriglobia bacterium]